LDQLELEKRKLLKISPEFVLQSLCSMLFVKHCIAYEAHMLAILTNCLLFTDAMESTQIRLILMMMMMIMMKIMMFDSLILLLICEQDRSKPLA